MSSLGAEILPVASSAVGTGALALWAFKMWVNSVNKKLEAQDARREAGDARMEAGFKEVMAAIHNIEKKQAKEDGAKEAAQELVWREINTGKIKAEKALSSTDKLWEAYRDVCAHFGIKKSERTSDKIHSLIDDSMKDK